MSQRQTSSALTNLQQDQYMFSLRSWDQRGNSKFDVQASYSPLFDNQTKQRINCIPSVQAANNQFLHTFFCPFQYPTEPRNVFAAALIYNKMKKDLTHQTNELFVARPKTGCCMICHVQYQDYIEHIQQNQHRTKQNKNIFTGYIKGLCHKFGHYRYSRSSSKKKSNQLRQSTVSQSREKEQRSHLLENVDRNDELLRQE